MPGFIRAIAHHEVATASVSFKVPDADEESGKNLAEISALFAEVVSVEEREEAFDAAYKLVEIGQEQRRQRLQDLHLTQDDEVVQFAKGIDQESAMRRKQQEAILIGSQSVKSVALKKILESGKTQTDEIMYYLNTGFNIAHQISQGGKKIEDSLHIQQSSAFLEAWKGLEDKLKLTKTDVDSINLIKSEFSFFVDIGIQYAKLDIAISNMTVLKRAIVNKKAEIEQADGESKKALKLELTRLRQQERELKKEIDALKENLQFSELNSLVARGVHYTVAISNLVQSGFKTNGLLNNLTKQIAFVGSLITFTSTVRSLVHHGKGIYRAHKNIKALKRVQTKEAQKNVPDNLNDINKMLVRFKLRHLEQSKTRLKKETAFSMLRGIVASMELSAATIACLAVISGMIIATPGLNTTIAVLGAVVFVVITGIEIYHKMKHDRNGMRLDVQGAEESHKTFALSGKFYTKAGEFQELQMQIRELHKAEHEILNKLKQEASGQEDAKVQQIEAYYAEQLEPIIAKRMEAAARYNALQSELLVLSKHLDELIAKKEIFKSHRTMETVAQEFGIQKADLIIMANMFNEALKTPGVKEELIKFLTERGVAITSTEDIFASMLRFMREDAEGFEEVAE